MASRRATIFALALACGVLAGGSGSPPASAADGSESQSSTSKTSSSEGSKKQRTQTRPAQTRPAQKTAAKPKAPAPKKQGAALSFTDEDLQKYHSGGEAQPVRNAPPAPGPDPLKTIKEEQERNLWRQKRTAELQQKVTDLEARLKTLEKRKLSIQNPLLPRVADPDQNPQAEIGMSGPELLARTDEEIKVTNQLLEAARKDLATFLEKKP
jgi:hypothetical protein